MGEGQQRPKKRILTTVQYNRSPNVIAWVKLKANGYCDLCGERAPFDTEEGPYLECHHIIHLADEGPDTIENTVALCPNCHRRMHALDLLEDRAKLTERAQARE